MNTINELSKKTQNTEVLESFLSFKLNDEMFAINVGKVMEILEVPKITKVPQAPDYMIGVINLRGLVLPVIDTRIKFGMQAFEFNVNTCVLVLNVEMGDEKLVVGAIVDMVLEVFEIEKSNIQPSPSLGAKYNPEFISGMIKENDQFMMVLNIDKVFSAEELENINMNNKED